MYADESNGYNRLGRRDGCRRLITHAHRETRWRFCRKHTGVPRSRISLPRTCAKKAMENDREEFGPQSDNTSFSLMRDTLSLCLPLFYSSRRETVCHPFTSHLFSVLSDRDTPRFSTCRILLPRIRPLYLPIYSIQLTLQMYQHTPT